MNRFNQRNLRSGGESAYNPEAAYNPKSFNERVAETQEQNQRKSHADDVTDELRRVEKALDDLEAAVVDGYDEAAERFAKGGCDPDADDGDTDGVRTARQYLGKGLATLADMASLSPSDVTDAADRRQAGDATGDRWKLALYWATGKQFCGGSPSLTTDPDWSDGDDIGSRAVEGGTDGPNPGVDAGNLPHVPCYRFVGVAQYWNIPAHVRQAAVTLSRSGARGRPPP